MYNVFINVINDILCSKVHIILYPQILLKTRKYHQVYKINRSGNKAKVSSKIHMIATLFL